MAIETEVYFGGGICRPHTHTHIYCSMGIYIKYIFTHMYSIYKDVKDRVFCFIDVALFIYINIKYIYIMI